MDTISSKSFSLIRNGKSNETSKIYCTRDRPFSPQSLRIPVGPNRKTSAYGGGRAGRARARKVLRRNSSRSPPRYSLMPAQPSWSSVTRPPSTTPRRSASPSFASTASGKGQGDLRIGRLSRRPQDRRTNMPASAFLCLRGRRLSLCGGRGRGATEKPLGS